MPLELKHAGPRQVQIVPYEEAPLLPHQVRAQALLSGISHGTEMNLYRGTSPFADKRFDADLRLFLPDDGSEPEIRLGYEWVGRVTEVGAQVEHLSKGDLVHLLMPHRQTHTVDPFNIPYHARLEALPPDLSPDKAIFLALAGVALQAIHDARVKTGDRVAIFGLGVIGLLAVQLARIDGASWIDGVDPIPARRALAAGFGADRTLDPAACDVGYEIKAASSQRGGDTAGGDTAGGDTAGADVAIELSGNYAALHEAIRSVRMGGTVVAGGFYQGGGQALRLGEEWHHNRITMISSMAAWQCPHRDYPLWDRSRINATVTGLLASGRLRSDGLISHRIPFTRAAEAYDLIDRHPADVVKVALEYEIASMLAAE